MLDYQGLAALSAIIETQSFQKAAEKLFITQSAVSQRLKNLENFHGEPLLIRTEPYRATALGLSLLRHFKRIRLMEEALNEELQVQPEQQRISIAISRDSLETWFVHVIEGLKHLSPFSLEITADDQDVTFQYFQNGLVSACASTRAKGLSGCKTLFLGYLDYVLVASPAFKKRYFNDPQKKRSNLKKAPAIIFNHHDKLHSQYLKNFFDMDDSELSYHLVPSVAGFKQFTVNGYAYALIPEIDIKAELREGKLIKLYPEKVWEMPVYWHYWAIETKQYQLFNELVIQVGKKILRQAAPPASGSR